MHCWKAARRFFSPPQHADAKKKDTNRDTAMKPGEDPKELERRRDLWVQPQSLKGLMRMLLPEYDKACARVVPGSQCDFTAEKNAPAQTLTARLHAEERKKKENRQPKGGMGKRKERKKTDNPREGWEDGTPPPHRDFKERVWCTIQVGR